MDDVMGFLKGKKTYLLAGAAAVVIGLHLAGVVSADLTNTALGLLGFGSIAALRAGVASSSES